MKTIIKYLLITVLLTGSIAMNSPAKAQSVSVSLSIFKDALSPYGRWVNYGSWGQVWISNERNFVPYQTDGHWVYTDDGWTWVSDYDWGWAPFHYGRWGFDANYGWYWVPDYEWAPAWVAWRSSGDYYGWAPISPGLNISVGVGYVDEIPSGRWTFAPHQYINSPYVSRYYAPRTNNVTIIKNTTIINNVIVKNNVHVDAGPRREDVERVNHTKIQTYSVANSSRPGKTVVNKNTVNVYRPVINKTTVVNNNNKTVINKNTNNNTVNKNNSNASVAKSKTTVNRNNENTTVEKKPTVKKVDNTRVNNDTHIRKPAPKPQPQPEQSKPVTHHTQAQPEQNKTVTHSQPKPQTEKPVTHNTQPKPQTTKKPEPKPQQNHNDNKPPKDTGKKGRHH